MEEERKISIKERVKKTNLKKAIKMITIVMGLLLIIFMTIVNIGFDPDHFDFFKWLTSSLILVGIMVFFLLIGESSGTDKQMENVNGLYQKDLKLYNDMHEIISSIEIYFSQFYIWFKARELINKKLDYLVSNDIDQLQAHYIVKYVNKEDLETLKRETIIKHDEKKNKDIKIKKLSEEEYVIISKIFTKEMLLNAPNYSYFLSAFGKSKNSTMVEQKYEIEKQMAANKRFNRIWKISFSLFISFIWGLLTVNDFMRGDDMQAWMNLVSRLTAAATSFFSGWLSSVIDVKLKAELLENKYLVLKYFKTFYDNGDFKPKSYEELADEEYAKEQEEKRKARESVIEPEIVKPLLEDKTIYQSPMKDFTK